MRHACSGCSAGIPAPKLNRGTGNLRFQADTLDHLGDSHWAAGEPDAARDRWRRAAGILDDMQHPDVELIRAKLARR